ncbi:MAG: ligase-associated DNA damage response endonuclease PdeM [Bacteroidota bacterium]
MIENIEILGQNLSLHPSGAMFWNEEQMLLISDVHLGKISHFRKYGSAVPQNGIAENFERLSQVVDHFQPEKICFLGDLFHSSLNLEWDLFENWMQDISAEVMLVVGNHDIISELKYEALEIEVYSELILENLLLTHHPETRENYFNLCGHLHPGYKLNGAGRQQVKLRCFYKSGEQLILPAFGEFTGNYWITPNVGDQVFVITKKEVILVY